MKDFANEKQNHIKLDLALVFQAMLVSRRIATHKDWVYGLVRLLVFSSRRVRETHGTKAHKAWHISADPCRQQGERVREEGTRDPSCARWKQASWQPAAQEGKQIEGLKLAFEGLKLVLGRTARRRPAARTSKLAGSQQCRRESKKKFELSSIWIVGLKLVSSRFRKWRLAVWSTGHCHGVLALRHRPWT